MRRPSQPRDKQKIVDAYLAAWRWAYPLKPQPPLYWAGDGFRLFGCLETTKRVLQETAELRMLGRKRPPVQRRPVKLLPRKRPVKES